MPMPNADAAEGFIKYYSGLSTEESKLRFLQMLKERRDLNLDPIAGDLLPKLAERWVLERVKR